MCIAGCGGLTHSSDHGDHSKHGAADGAIDEDWEDWNPLKSSFFIHCFAGSIAGVVEHTFMFPIDTVKTHMQSMNSKYHNSNSSLNVIKGIYQKEGGAYRMWRGVSTMFSACIPAHAAYFSVLEKAKEKFGANSNGHTPFAAAASGCVASIAHDLIMAPADLCKQRMQLGYYDSSLHAIRSIVKSEGLSTLWVAFPTTLLMNIPYACVMVSANESIRQFLNPEQEYDFKSFAIAGALSGGLASIVTCPMDVVRTYLQTGGIAAIRSSSSCCSTNNLATSNGSTSSAANSKRHYTTHFPSSNFSNKPSNNNNDYNNNHHHRSKFSSWWSSNSNTFQKTREVSNNIYQREGVKGFFKGVQPRVMLHAPSVAISWSTYEFMKMAFQSAGYR